MRLSRFAYTTYAETLIESRTWARGGDDGDPAAFLVKMQTLDDMVTDFVPPLTETYRMVYEAQYIYRPCPSIKVTDPFPEPTIPVCLPPDDVDAAPNDAKVDDTDNNKAVSYPSLHSWPRLSLRPVKPRFFAPWVGPPGTPPREAWPPPPVADDDETTVASTSVFGNRVSNDAHTTPSSDTTRQSRSNQRLG